MYNDRANLPFGIDTDISGNYELLDGTTKAFTRRLNITVNVNMPFSIFFKQDFPDKMVPNETVFINFFTYNKTFEGHWTDVTF